MKRKELIRSKNYLVAQIQLKLLNLIGNYKDKKKLKDYQLANELGVSKGYVSQLLNATFDHKISKVIDLALACNTVPILTFVDLDEYIKNDANDKIYELIAVVRPKNMTYTQPISQVTGKTDGLGIGATTRFIQSQVNEGLLLTPVIPLTLNNKIAANVS